MGWLKKIVKKAVGKIFGVKSEAPAPPPPPAVQIETPDVKTEEVDSKIETESDKKQTASKGKKGLIVKRKRIGQGLNI